MQQPHFSPLPALEHGPASWTRAAGVGVGAVHPRRQGAPGGYGRPRAGAGGRCASRAARPAVSLPPAVECAGGRTGSPPGEQGRGPGRARGSAVRGAAAAAAEPGAAPARRACVCERACVRGSIEPGEGAGGVSLRRGLRRARARAARAADRPRPRPLTHAALRPPPGRGPRRGRGAAAGGGVCAHPPAHRHTPATPQTHATHRATAGAPSPPGAARIAPRSHSHSPSRAGPAVAAAGGGARPGARLGLEVSEFLRIRAPAAGGDRGSGRWDPRTPPPPVGGGAWRGTQRGEDETGKAALSAFWVWGCP